jgi:clan AA aspartic protease (TIGR02281 family)
LKIAWLPLIAGLFVSTDVAHAQGPPSAFDTGAVYALPPDRIAPIDIQKALLWTNHYDGMVDGAVGKGTKAAIASWQAANSFPANGTLTSDQITALIKQGLQQRRQWEWANYTAPDRSFSVGVPRRLFKDPVQVSGSETRFDGLSPDYRLTITRAYPSTPSEFSSQFTQLTESNWNRTTEFSVQREDWWVVSGLEGGNAFYVRAELHAQTLSKMIMQLPRNRTQEQGFLVTAIANSFRAGLNTSTPSEMATSATGGPVAQPPRSLGPNVEIQMVNNGGTYFVPVRINNTITLDFVLDSGATDVSVPSDVFSTLVRTGTITKDDVLGRQTYQLADGSTKNALTFRVRSLQVGTLTLQNVRGSVAEAAGPLLLGMSFLRRFSSWSVDNDRHVLILR